MSTPAPGPLRQMLDLRERTVAAYLEAWVGNPLVLTASGAWLNGLLTVRKLADDGVQALSAAVGLANRRDQEKMLHLLHTIVGRLDDIEHELGLGVASAIRRAASQRSASQGPTGRQPAGPRPADPIDNEGARP